MDVIRQVKWMSGAVLSVLLTLSMPVQADTSKKKELIIAGPIGKSSSASARITLVIPPRPQESKQPASQSTSGQQASETSKEKKKSSE